MASLVDILEELNRRTSKRPCPEIVWQKLVYCLPDYMVVGERQSGEEFAVVSGSEILGVGSGVGVKYETEHSPISIGSFSGRVVVGEIHRQIITGGLGEPDLSGYRSLELLNIETEDPLTSPMTSARINYATGEILTTWDSTSLTSDRRIEINYEYEEQDVVQTDGKFLYHTGKTPYDTLNPLEFGFIITEEPKNSGSTGTQTEKRKLIVYQNGSSRAFYNISTDNTSDVGKAFKNLMDAIRDVDQEEIYKWLTDSANNGGMKDLIISTSDSVIPPATPYDTAFQQTCKIEDYYTFM